MSYLVLCWQLRVFFQWLKWFKSANHGYNQKIHRFKPWCTAYESSNFVSWPKASQIQTLTHLNERGVNLGHDRKICWFEHWLTECQRSKCQSWHSDSVNNREVNHGQNWRTHILKCWPTESENLLHQNVLQIPALIHWMTDEAMSVMMERFADLNSDPLNARGVSLGHDSITQQINK